MFVYCNKQTCLKPLTRRVRFFLCSLIFGKIRTKPTQPILIKLSGRVKHKPWKKKTFTFGAETESWGGSTK